MADQFAEALDVPKRGGKYQHGNGYIESDQYIITWCVGHLVNLSYPEVYDPSLKKWEFATLPFIPKEWKYEVSRGTEKQFNIVSGQLNREDVDVIYIATDSAREGEYIYRLVDMMAGVDPKKERRRVWIDSQTKEEILRGIREAKPDSEYDNLSAAAFSRAKEDYLMGINFSRVISLKYRNRIRRELKLGQDERLIIAVGRVMTCVLGMIVKREQEIRSFQKTKFYRIAGEFGMGNDAKVSADWKPQETSRWYAPTDIYDGKGFLYQGKAVAFMKEFMPFPREAVVESLEKKKESKNAPLLYNLAELQNDCSRLFKINPDETLAVAQELYEKRMTTYPRTDARVLSTAVSREIHKNIQGLTAFSPVQEQAQEILNTGSYRTIAKTRYVDDKKIADHYAIIPTGQGIREIGNLKPLTQKVYELIARRFLSVFYPPAVYQRVTLGIRCNEELFQMNSRVLKEEGYLKVASVKKNGSSDAAEGAMQTAEDGNAEDGNAALAEALLKLKKGQTIQLETLSVKEGETSPPKRYTSGSMILAMENAGNLIEDEELRAQIKGAGIGTSATRAGILTKLEADRYIMLQKKTQVLQPTELGERLAYYVKLSVPHLLNPKLTASWEMGLSQVADGTISEKEYMDTLEKFVSEKTEKVKNM